jgi:tetratricopeptide (TPR) repeat protein
MTLYHPLAPALIATVLLGFSGSLLRAQEPSIDRLLNKLPPPEKFQKSPLERALRQEDPALNDSLMNEIGNAAGHGSYTRAMALTQKLIARYPHSPGAYCLQGILAYLSRQYAVASSNFRQALKERPGYSFAYFGLAAVELEQDHFAAALPHLEQFSKLEPDSTTAWVTLSYCARRLGKNDEAARCARRAIALSPASIDAWIQLARAEKGLGHPLPAIAALARAAQLMPNNAEIHAVVGFSYININRIADAVAPLERAARLSPRDFLIQSQLGFCLGHVGRSAEAISHLKSGASLNPKYGPVWEHLGLVYQKLGRHQEAVVAFEKAAQLLPQSSLPRQHLKEEYRVLGRAPAPASLPSKTQKTPSSGPKKR